MKFQELSRENKPPLYLGEDNRKEQAGFPIALFLLVKFHQKSTHIFFCSNPEEPIIFWFLFLRPMCSYLLSLQKMAGTLSYLHALHFLSFA